MKDNITGRLENELSECQDIQFFIEKNQEQFAKISAQEYLKRLFEQKGLLKKDVVRDCGLDQIYAYQILSGRKKGERDKLLCIAYAMGLSLEETNFLLYLSGKPKLYPRVKRDAVLIFGLYQKLSVSKVDDLLYEAKEATLLAK